VIARKQLNREVNGHRQIGWRTQTIQLNWSNVNVEEQDRSLFDGSLLKSQELIQAQIDAANPRKIAPVEKR